MSSVTRVDLIRPMAAGMATASCHPVAVHPVCRLRQLGQAPGVCEDLTDVSLDQAARRLRVPGCAVQQLPQAGRARMRGGQGGVRGRLGHWRELTTACHVVAGQRQLGMGAGIGEIDDPAPAGRGPFPGLRRGS